MSDANELIPTRQSLLIRLKDWNDQESWRVFFDTYWKLIYRAAIKAGLTEAEAEDVVQETVISVYKSMPDFDYRGESGSFKGWLLHLTNWRIQDAFRERQRQGESRDGGGDASGGSETDGEDDEKAEQQLPPELEMLWEEEWEKNLWDAAITRVKRKVDPLLYQAFDLYAFKQWPASRVSASLGLSPSKIYVAKHRIENLIREELDYLRTKLI